MPNTQKHIDRVCEYRDIPSVTKGMSCNCNGRQGKIVGGNSSSNFNVKFDANACADVYLAILKMQSEGLL